jgi:mRNA interferase HigB
LKSWFSETQAADWRTSQAIKRLYRHASFIADNRVIFNIGGNKYRLVVHVNYDFRIVYIKFIGTHAEYDRIDPETV